MKNFLVNFLSRVFTIAVILLLTFIFLHVIPGGPFDAERGLPPEIKSNLYQKYGLHERGKDPLWLWIAKDVGSYSKQLAHFHLGPSLKYENRDVVNILADALPASLTLGVASLLTATLCTLIAALLLTFYNKSWMENIFSLLSSIAIAMPSFVRAIVLVSLFSLTFRLFPPALWHGPQSAVLPIIALSITPFFLMTELLYNELNKERRKLYVTTAMAKGLSRKRILFKHVLRNSLNPLLAIMGPIATDLLTGSFVVETIFSIPGMGQHFVLAVIDRDYFLVMGITAVIATLLIFFNWLTDRLSSLLDPRMS